MKKQWILYNVSWLVAFVILMGFLEGIPLISLAFLVVALLFTWILTRSKSEAPWIAWIIPYFFAFMLFTWFFVRGSFTDFVFYRFWISLKDWFSSPNPFGFAIILAVLSYFVIYLVSSNIKKTFNSSIVLAITAAVVGVVAQFVDPFVDLGMALLFLFSIILNSMYNGTIRKPTFKVTGIVLLAFLLVFMATFTLKTISPFGNLFSNLSVSSQSTSTSTSVPTGHTIVVPSGIPSKGISISNFGLNWLYDILLYIVGIFAMATSAILIFFFIKYREKKKIKIKNFLTIVWMIISALFIFISVLYFIGIPKPSALPLTETHESHAAGMTYIASSTLSATSMKASNYSIPSFFFMVLLAIVGAFAIVIIYYVFKYGIPISGGSEEHKAKSEQNFEFREEKLDFEGPPDKVVLFYYNILRQKIGDPTLTPYEFSIYLNKYVDQKVTQRMTEIFVGLRYARNKITAAEAQFFKTTVINILSPKSE